jgi:hypothetical protein
MPHVVVHGKKRNVQFDDKGHPFYVTTKDGHRHKVFTKACVKKGPAKRKSASPRKARKSPKRKYVRRSPKPCNEIRQVNMCNKEPTCAWTNNAVTPCRKVADYYDYLSKYEPNESIGVKCNPLGRDACNLDKDCKWVKGATGTKCRSAQWWNYIHAYREHVEKLKKQVQNGEVSPAAAAASSAAIVDAVANAEAKGQVPSGTAELLAKERSRRLMTELAKKQEERVKAGKASWLTRPQGVARLPTSPAGKYGSFLDELKARNEKKNSEPLQEIVVNRV